jgi:hypothetical protein
MLRLLSLWWSFLLVAAIAGAAVPPAPFAKLRPQSPRVAAWIARGLAESATFRALVARIEAGDVIVYLEARPDFDRGVSACVTWMAATPWARFVRASLRPDLPGREAVAMIAHELQHVIEVLDHPDVRSELSLAGLYARIGHSTTVTGRRWDTRAALAAGARVRLELPG